jgi:YHS domain-containing protein
MFDQYYRIIRSRKMNKILPAVLVTLLTVTGLLISSCSEEAQSPPKTGAVQTSDTDTQLPSNQTRDAISGNRVNKDLYADYEGKRVYFCCAESKKTFASDPQPYLIAFREQGVILEVAP